MFGTRTYADRFGLSQGHRVDSHVNAESSLQSSNHLLHHEEPPETKGILDNLHVTPASGGSRSAGHRLLHGRRGDLELQRRLAVGKRRVQALQVPANVQSVPEYLRAGADWR